MLPRLRPKPILQRAAQLVQLLRLAGAEGLRDLDRFHVRVGERDHAVVGAGRLDDIVDVIGVAPDLRHRLSSHPADAVFERGHAHFAEQEARQRGLRASWPPSLLGRTLGGLETWLRGGSATTGFAQNSLNALVSS